MPRLKKATDASGVVFYPITISKGVWDTEHNQRLSESIAEIYDAIWYFNVYVGAAASSSTVINSTYYHTTVTRGRPITINNADNDYIWVVMPTEYTPVVLMSGTEVPMELDSTTTIQEDSFKIWKSSDTHSGSFNLLLF